MKELDPAGWERREAYAYFSRLSCPFFMVTFTQEVTGLYEYAKAHGLSFYEVMIWACTKALNSVKAFRVVRRGGRLFELDFRHPSFTDLKRGEEQFRIITMEYSDDLFLFCREASRLRAARGAFIDEDKESDDLVYLTCLPWIDLTALSNERDLSSPEALDDSIPRIAWGRFTLEGGRRTLGISVEVNHRFADGVHVGRFAEKLTEISEGLRGPGAGCRDKGMDPPGDGGRTGDRQA